MNAPGASAKALTTGPQPDARGYFGGEAGYGGRYIPETLMPACEELERAYLAAKNDPAFNRELETLFREYVGRPSPLTYAERMTSRVTHSEQLTPQDAPPSSGGNEVPSR